MFAYEHLLQESSDNLRELMTVAFDMFAFGCVASEVQNKVLHRDTDCDAYLFQSRKEQCGDAYKHWETGQYSSFYRRLLQARRWYEFVKDLVGPPKKRISKCKTLRDYFFVNVEDHQSAFFQPMREKRNF